MNKHPKWKEEISKEAAENKNSPHTNPNWLRDLTGYFYNVVIANCSQKCKDAVRANKVIKGIILKNDRNFSNLFCSEPQRVE